MQRSMISIDFGINISGWLNDAWKEIGNSSLMDKHWLLELGLLKRIKYWSYNYIHNSEAHKLLNVRYSFNLSDITKD